MLSLHLPTFIFVLINIIVFSLIIAAIIIAVHSFRNFMLKINKIDKKLDTISDKLENKQ